MEKLLLGKTRAFVESYFLRYGNRDFGIKAFFDDDFMGLDGISRNIYNKEGWFEALSVDFQQISAPFSINIVDFDIRVIESGLVIVTVVSFWDIKLLVDFPEFDKIRSVFILRPKEDSFSIVHLSNSLSLLAFDRKEVYPITLSKFLKSWKKTLFKLGRPTDDDLKA